MKEECGVKSITECSDPKNSKSAQVPIKISVNYMCYLKATCRSGRYGEKQKGMLY